MHHQRNLMGGLHAASLNEPTEIAPAGTISDGASVSLRVPRSIKVSHDNAADQVALTVAERMAGVLISRGAKLSDERACILLLLEQFRAGAIAEHIDEAFAIVNELRARWLQSERAPQ